MPDKLSYLLFHTSGQSHLWPLKAWSFKRVEQLRKQTSTYQSLPSTSEAPSPSTNTTHVASTLRLLHQTQQIRALRELSQHVADLPVLVWLYAGCGKWPKSTAWGWATQPGKCRPIKNQVFSYDNPEAWPAESLQQLRSRNATLFDCPMFSTGHKGFVTGLSPSTFKNGNRVVMPWCLSGSHRRPGCAGSLITRYW